ncbi:MAG TPA: type II toxin-antitoxin system VapC family toxin [Jatrophihabitans sp.]|jgi:hypothetical protein
MVTLAYLDTSAALKLIIEEAESAKLADTLSSSSHQLVSSWLLHTEMHCAAGRHPQDIDLESVRAVLDTINLADLTRGDMIAAGTHAPLRSNDAIHLAVAIRLGVDELITYDQELAEAAASAGLTVLAPS